MEGERFDRNTVRPTQTQASARESFRGQLGKRERGGGTTGRRVVLAALALVLVGCGDDSGGEGFTEDTRPRIASDRTSLSFSVVELGESSEQILILQNLGDGPLVVRDMVVTGRGASFFEVYIEPGQVYGGEDFEIAYDPTANAREVLVRFTPTEVGNADAVLTIVSNDPDRAEYPVLLSSLEIGPRPQVVPNPVVFGQVDGGQTERREISIANVGSAPLRFKKIWITGSPDFTVEGENRDNIRFPPDGLLPNDSFPRTIVYAPPTQGPDLGKLNIQYQFGDDTRSYEADISANGAEPCIRITPQDSIDFGQAIIGSPTPITVTVENCGNQNLTVTDIRLGVDTAEEFELGDLPAEIVALRPVVLAKGSSRQFYVMFTPLEEGARSGTLIIDSDSPARPEITMNIFGIGTYNNCPEAKAVARVVNSGAPWSDQLVAEPLDYLEFSGLDSSDPDGNTIRDYRWSIVQHPPGFAVPFEYGSGIDAPARPQIQLALVGDYVFELIVVDQHGRESCSPARVTARAKSDKQLIIELVWRTPADLDETDTCVGCGTDLDLHFLAPGAYWNIKPPSGPSDCYYNNSTPLWADPSSFDDDPRLDRDDTDGGGPEQINVKTPARTDGTGGAFGYTAPYEVGVYYFDNHGIDPPDALATVRIFLDGQDVPSFVLPTVPAGQEAAVPLVTSDRTPAKQGHFWHVGYLDWTAGGGAFTESTPALPGIGFPQ